MFLGKKNLTLILLIAICFTLTSCGKPAGGSKTSGNSQGAPAIRQMAPDFNLVDLNGKILSLSSMKGNVVLLNFWSTGCQPCKDEMPQFQRIYETLFVGRYS